jgi:hypothetical protein
LTLVDCIATLGVGERLADLLQQGWVLVEVKIGLGVADLQEDLAHILRIDLLFYY